MPSDLAATHWIDSDHPEILAQAKRLAAASPRDTAIALFNWVRDEIRYDPYHSIDPAPSYRASAVLQRGSGYCVQKAVLLAALGRAAGIPTRVGFADVINHKNPPRLREIMGTDLYVFHGYTSFEIEGEWVKATPAFDARTTVKAGVLPVELDGSNDAMLHPVDPEGHPSIEYVRDRGTFDDLPIEELQRTLLETYGQDGFDRFIASDRRS